jgi:hypothetical protein
MKPLNTLLQHPMPPPEVEDVVVGMSTPRTTAASVTTGQVPAQVPHPTSPPSPIPAPLPVPERQHSKRIPIRPGSGPVVIEPGIVPGAVEKADRSGPVTGARIVLFVQRRPMSSGALANRLRMEESYIRRVCRMLVDAGILRAEIKPQRGTRPLRVYSLAFAVTATPPAMVSNSTVIPGAGTSPSPIVLAAPLAKKVG